ncbi:MAG: hypothetical protein K8F27_14250 [Sulfuricellaceae bacterium]|nr:hypothetical protein [Sulfuricellaceae bacterium]
MNQSFKKKVIAVSVTAAFVAIGAGFVAVPGIAPISAAQANQFADTTQVSGVSVGVAVPSATNVVVTGQTFTITESTGAAIGPSAASGMGGSVILSLSGGAKFKAGTKVTLSNSGWDFFTGSGTAMAANSTTTLAAADIVNGTIPLYMGTAQSNVGAGGTISLTTINLDTSSSSVGSAVAVSISSSSTATGLTTGVSSTLATVSASAVSAVSAATTATNVATGQTLTMDQINLTETILGSFANNATVGADVTVELQGGLTWAAAPTMATLSGDDVTNGAGASLAGAALSSTGAGYAKASYQFETTTGTTQASGVKFSGGTVFIPSGTAVGDLNAVVTVYKNNAILSQTTVKVGKIVNSGTTASFVDATGATAAADYNTLFTGRNYAGGLVGGVGAENDTMKVAEVVAGSLAQNGTVSLALSTGKFGAAPTEVNTSTLTMNAGVLSTDKKSASYTVSSAATTTAGSATYTFGNLDMTAATPGDLNVTVGGTAGITASTVKMAEVVNATNASVASGAQTVTANSVFTLPVITITEGKYSALAAGNVIGIELPAGYTIQKGSADAVDGGTLTNGTDVTVKVVDTTGADVTSTALGASPTLTIGNGTAGGTARQLFIAMSAASANASGTYTITVTGLKAKSVASAPAGTISAVIAGADSAGVSTAVAMGGEDASTWTSKASATKATVTVGSIVSSTVPSIPAATITGPITAQTISASIVPAGNDLGKQGSVFVAAVLPASLGGGVFFESSSGAWTAFTSCATAPAYTTGSLASVSNIAVVGTAGDLSSLVGTQVYVGYGTGGALSPAGTACNSMLSNGTYNLSYTIK